MLDFCRDPSVAGTLLAGSAVGAAIAFWSAAAFAEFASNNLRNCSLFIFAIVGEPNLLLGFLCARL